MAKERSVRGKFGTVLRVAAVLLAVCGAGALAVGIASDGFTDWTKFRPHDTPAEPGDPAESVFGLSDMVTVGAFGEIAVFAGGEDSPARAAHSGVTYGAISPGMRMTFSGTIVQDGNTEMVWYTPLVGIYGGETGFIVRSDNWVIGGSPDGLFSNVFSGMPDSGIADEASGLWTVYSDGTFWGAAEAKSAAAYEAEFTYTDAGVITIVQRITAENGTETEHVYSAHVPEGEYNTYFYGEQCSYTWNEMTVTKI